MIPALSLLIWLAPLVSPAAEDFDRLLAEGKSLYSEGKGELVIRHFFQDRPNGFYLDIGCYHWKSWSTTYYLEEHLGWSGIGVDAQEIFAAGWREHRPRSKFVPVAVTDKSGETITFYQAFGISSTEKRNIEKWQKVKDFEPKVMTVPTLTMNDLLAREGVTKIDFLSMDINGGEPKALAGFDIERFRPDLVHIEANPYQRSALLEYFEKHGYERIDAYLEHDRTNWYFQPRPVRGEADAPKP